MPLKRILLIWSVSMTILGVGFLVWAIVVHVRLGDGIDALYQQARASHEQAQASKETNRAMIRLAERVDVQAQADVLLRDRIIQLESIVKRLDQPQDEGGADARGSDADAQ